MIDPIEPTQVRLQSIDSLTRIEVRRMKHLTGIEQLMSWQPESVLGAFSKGTLPGIEKIFSILVVFMIVMVGTNKCEFLITFDDEFLLSLNVLLDVIV